MKSFPKILRYDHVDIRDTLPIGMLEITEKIDGSQIRFGVLEGKLEIHSKKKNITESGDKRFDIARKQIISRKDKLLEGYTYYGEYLSKPKHNSIDYGEVPEGHIALFAIRDCRGHFFKMFDKVIEEAVRLKFSHVTLHRQVVCKSKQEFNDLIQSVVGGLNGRGEGVVINNVDLGVRGKYVFDSFKEVRKSVKSRKDKIEDLAYSLRTEARWKKALQSLQDSGELTNTNRDIGPLIKTVFQDLEEEESEVIKDFLYKHYKKRIFSEAVRGISDWVQTGKFEE